MEKTIHLLDWGLNILGRNHKSLPRLRRSGFAQAGNLPLPKGGEYPPFVKGDDGGLTKLRTRR